MAERCLLAPQLPLHFSSELGLAPEDPLRGVLILILRSVSGSAGGGLIWSRDVLLLVADYIASPIWLRSAWRTFSLDSQ